MCVQNHCWRIDPVLVVSSGQSDLLTVPAQMFHCSLSLRSRRLTVTFSLPLGDVPFDPLLSRQVLQVPLAIPRH